MRTRELLNKILDFHSQGLNNRQIAKLIGKHHTVVGYWLKKENLKCNGTKRQSLNTINEYEAICSKCNEIHKIENFLLNRQNAKYPYRLSYCNNCRKQQLYKLLNKLDKFLIDRYRRLKLRAKKSNIPFNLDKDYFINIYKLQNGKCFYTNIDMVIAVGKGSSWDAFSVDKIIPEKGYVKGNVVFCRKKINTAKGLLSLEEIRLYMPFWYDKLVSTNWLELGV